MTPPESPAQPKLPPFPIEKVIAARDRLIAALHLRVGKVPEGAEFKAFCEELAFALETGPSDPAVAETVRALPRAPLTAAALRTFCWRITARLTELHKGLPVRPWVSQPRPEWAAFEVLTGAFHRTRLGKPGYKYQCRVLSGSACPEIVEVWWSWLQIRRVAKVLGFAKQGRKKRPYQHPMQLVRLRFAAQLVPERSTERPGFDLSTFRVPSKFLAHNAAILSQRIRREPPCPFQFTHPCQRCPVGYAVGQVTCPAAVRPVSWQWKHCPSCNKEAFWDPTSRARECIDCATRPAGDL